ncbi:binding-protein-dependent transport systems inner membrane component [Sulfolobus islandicus Y.G.57.14]|uniref:Binding-protein-dependent transport systems inner membrane component n=1 Tax=Saccharolobus islandicus (strain Y.G.57.14 / Yellowstone \|nr:ABC transporter permease [Sulfolobus islandicus]ACP46772.1 binding-protein-dependent transport systems inner membrane component [Sulfolobus islandicus Y.G.57.14]
MIFYKFLIKRAIEAFLVIMAELIIVFYLANIAAPNPASVWAGPEASPEQIQLVTELYHLNQPWYIQLYYYLGNFFTGKWGISPLYQTPVISLIEEYLPVTIELAIIALILKIILEISLGILSALKPNGLLDNSIRVVYTITRSAPPFIVALLLLLILSYYFHVFPSSYYMNPILALHESKFYIQIGGHKYYFWFIDNMPILNSLLVGDIPAFVSALDHSILPALALTLFGFGGIVRLTRNSMLEVLNTDYIKTARAKGLKERIVITRHALRNALLSSITLISVIFAGLMQGSLVVETIFNYYGIGYLVAESLLNLDTPTLIAATVVITIVVVISNLVADISYALLDPRIREAL